MLGATLTDRSLGQQRPQRIPPPCPPQIYDVLRADSTNETIALLKRETARTAGPDRRDRIELAGIDFHWPNASLVHELDNTLGYNPLRLGLYSKATGAGDHVALPDQRSFSPLMPGYRSLLADMLGLRFIATGVPVEQIDKALKPGDLAQIARTQGRLCLREPARLAARAAGDGSREGRFRRDPRHRPVAARLRPAPTGPARPRRRRLPGPAGPGASPARSASSTTARREVTLRGRCAAWRLSSC